MNFTTEEGKTIYSHPYTIEVPDHIQSIIRDANQTTFYDNFHGAKVYIPEESRGKGLLRVETKLGQYDLLLRSVIANDVAMERERHPGIRLIVGPAIVVQVDHRKYRVLVLSDLVDYEDSYGKIRQQYPVGLYHPQSQSNDISPNKGFFKLLR